LRFSLGRPFRIAVAAGLTLFVLWKANPSAVLRATGAADPAWIAAAVALVVFDRALMAYRWIVLLRALDPAARPPLGAVIRVFFVSTFVGTFLPSVGGDVVRAFGLSKLGVAASASAASVLLDRVLGVLSILLVGLLGVAIAGREVADRGVVLALVIAAAGCAAAGLVVFSERAAAWLHRVAARLPLAAVGHGGAALIEALRRYRHRHGDLLNVIAGSVGVQLLRVVQAYCLGRALGIGAPLLVYLAYVPLILLIMLLPITVNGLGTSQVAFVWLFGRAGVDEPRAFALSVLFVALGAVGNLPGGILYALGRAPAPSAGTAAR
jgi:hypothetical protein